MLLVPPQGCWPGPPFQKGCPAPTQTHQPQSYVDAKSTQIPMKHRSTGYRAQRSGQEGLPWEGHDRGSLCWALVLAAQPATCILICQSQLTRTRLPVAGCTRSAFKLVLGVEQEIRATPKTLKKSSSLELGFRVKIKGRLFFEDIVVLHPCLLSGFLLDAS